jgi:hypothetical protein
MYDILKTICTAESFPFVYARRDFQNLYNEVEQKNVPHLFLDPVIIEDVVNDMNVIEGKIYSGDFMVLVSSDIDEESYDARYQNHIKPLIDSAVATIKETIRCGQEVTFNLWRTIEVINAFDYNFDGLIVSYNITIEE